MPIFYTGKGDKGKSFVGKVKIDKTDSRMYALGDLDELNSLLGLIKTQKVPKQFKNYLHQTQENLFIIQATIGALLVKTKFPPPVFKKEKITETEKLIEQIENQVKPARKFIIPGTNQVSAWFDYARAISRRAERSLLKVAKSKKISPDILAYMNRLSSLLFALARYAVEKNTDTHPIYK